MEKRKEVIGLAYALLAFFTWGLLPLYWKLLNQVPAGEILAHRIFWSFIFVLGIIILGGKLNTLKTVFKEIKKVCYLFISSLLLSINWFTYIWAVNANFVVEASLGYYMLPLATVLLSITVLREKINIAQIIALSLAAVGVYILASQYGRIPWIALVLAITFAMYGLIKKTVQVEPIIGIAIETALITPIAFIFLTVKQMQGTAAFINVALKTDLLLVGAGIATALPLIWFAKGAQTLKLSTIGFLEYIAPTISLLLGVFVFKEQFSILHLISFGFIWAAIIVYTFSKTSFYRALTFRKSSASKSRG